MAQSFHYATNFGQKRILTVQDISCFGKCSLTVALPILSAFGHETVILPTAVLSTHTSSCFSHFRVSDLTGQIRPFSDHWKEEGIGFDCIYTGYLCAGEQTKLVSDLIRDFRTDKTLVVVDPAMADNGKLYVGFDMAHVQEMKALCLDADLITPNVTEAALMTGREYSPDFGEREAFELADELAKECRGDILITSVVENGKIGVVARWKNGEHFSYYLDREQAPGHGSGDVFTSALVGKLMQGEDLLAASSFAARFTVAAIRATIPYIESHPYGLMFEKVLPMIAEK